MEWMLSRWNTTSKRTCTNPPCPGRPKARRMCPCTQVNGGWSGYSQWSSCTKTCGGGTRTGTRTCTNPAPSCCGKRCTGSDKQTVNCNPQPCPTTSMAYRFVYYVLRNKWATKSSSSSCIVNLRPVRDAPSPATGYCPDCDYPERDFLLIMDSSGSIGEANYNQAKEDLAVVAGNLCGDLGTDLQVAAIQFSDGPEMEFPFDEYLSKLDLYDDIESWTWMDGMTLTWRAFNFSEVVMFKPAQGNRPGAHKQALIVTDGASNTGVNPRGRSIDAAQELKDSGVEVFALWIGKATNIAYDEIRAYVSDPVDEHAFTVDSVQSLNEFAGEIDLMYEKLCC